MHIYGSTLNPEELLNSAREKGKRLAGYYNENLAFSFKGHRILVRHPLENAERMDLHFFREDVLLQILEPNGLHVPKVLAVSEDPYLYVEEYIDGTVLNDTCPRGVAVPDHFIGDVIALFDGLKRINSERLECFFPTDWPMDNSHDFFLMNKRMVYNIWERYKGCYKNLYRHFCPLEDPFDILDQDEKKLANRPFSLVHADIHRKNCVIHENKTYFLDWEMALLADPAYDVAVHLQKMQYLPQEESLFWQLLSNSQIEDFPSFKKDVEIFIKLERIKSFVVETVRAQRHFSDPEEKESVKAYVAQQFAKKVALFQTLWNGDVLDPHEIYTLMSGFKPGESA